MVTIPSDGEKRQSIFTGTSLPPYTTPHDQTTVFFTDADHALYLRLIPENLPESGHRILAYRLMSHPDRS